MTFRLIEQLESHAATNGDGCAYREVGTSTGDRALSWRELRTSVHQLAGWIAARVHPGATVLLCCPNVCEFPVVFLGILSAGCTVFPVSPDITAPELLAAASKSSARAIIGTGKSIVAMAGRDIVSLSIEDIVSIDPGGTNLSTPSRAKSGSLLLQSSGTTGLPKIVRRSRQSLDAVCSNMVRAIGFTPSDRVLATVPLCHSYGLEHGLLAPIWAGSTVHLCRGLDLQIAIDQLQRRGITVLPGVPSMFEMLGTIGDQPHDMPTLRSAYSAGARLPATVAERFHRRHGVRVGQVYGATEVGSITYNDPAAPDAAVESIGRPMQDVRIEIRALSDQHRSLAPGEEGQVWVKAPSMFDGYVGDPLLHTGDWYCTGDLGQLDDAGNLFITGRLKLLIDVGGLKVNPMEVEEVILRYPGVGACVVVPIRLSETVSRLKAIVTPKEASTPPDVTDLRRFVRSQLSSYKVPRMIEIRAALPRSATGKVLRHLVEAM